MLLLRVADSLSLGAGVPDELASTSAATMCSPLLSPSLHLLWPLCLSVVLVQPGHDQRGHPRRQRIPVLCTLQLHGQDLGICRSFRHVSHFSTHQYVPPRLRKSAALTSALLLLADNTSTAFYFLFGLGIVSCAILPFIDIERSNRQCARFLEEERSELYSEGELRKEKKVL